MTDTVKLRNAIDESGLKITFIAEKMECSRGRIYSILNGAECTASEIVKLGELLRMTKATRDAIFLPSNVT